VRLDKLDSAFLNYMVERDVLPGERLPTLAEMSEDIGMSVGKLREQLEVARTLGLVSVRPRVGTQREPFDFLPAVRNSAFFGLATGEASFSQFSQLRRVLETGLWDEAVVRLTEADKERLREIVAQAWQKLREEPVHIPNREHRALHLTIFSRLDNPFVQGILEAYWDMYEASELTRLASYDYWLTVWSYHEQLVDAICAGEFERGRQLLVEHFRLLPTVQPTVSDNGENEV
jgi:DNA-binding FadR family transcriptional regulator